MFLVASDDLAVVTALSNVKAVCNHSFLDKDLSLILTTAWSLIASSINPTEKLYFWALLCNFHPLPEV